MERAEDFAVWEHMAYLERLALARGDGPIAAYRRWCRQFCEALPVRGAQGRVAPRGL